ncbi:unnamed protein product, partial [Nesidiocoris tenuis]
MEDVEVFMEDVVVFMVAMEAVAVFTEAVVVFMVAMEALAVLVAAVSMELFAKPLEQRAKQETVARRMAYQWRSLSIVAQVRTQDEETYSSQNDSSAAQEDSNDSASADDNEQSGPVSEADSASSARTLRSNVLSPLVLQGASSIWSPSARQIASPTNANPSNALLNVLSGLLNSPKGNLGKLPLCNLKQLTGVPSGVNTPPSQLNLQRLQSLIALLSSPQALRPCVKFPRPEFIPQPLNPYLPFIPSNPQTFPVPQCNIPGLCEQTSNTNINQIGGPTPVNGPLSCGEDSFIKHVPVVQKIIRQVIETRTRHVPVIKKRIRTVVEPYTSHVPVLEKFARPVEDTIVRTVPVGFCNESKYPIRIKCWIHADEITQFWNVRLCLQSA